MINIYIFSLCVCFSVEGALLQSQLFLLELLRAQHDGILVYSGLQTSGNQQEPHHLLLQSLDQLRHPHGSSGKCGKWPSPCGFAQAIFLSRLVALPSR